MGTKPFDLGGRHALVTAAGAPLGAALARALAQAGADVSVLTAEDAAPDEKATRDTLDACLALGRRGTLERVRLADADAVRHAVAAAEAELSPIDILVNAAHRPTVKPFLDTGAVDWSRELDANLLAALATTHAVGPGMRERGWGRVINVVSLLAERAMPNAALIGASQGALLGFTRSLGLEWIRSGVVVNALCIGFFDAATGPQQDPEVRRALEKYTPVRRLGRPEDLAGAVVFLASEQAGYVVSEALLVDGGLATHA